MRQRPFTSVFATFLILSTSTSTALGYYNPKLGRFMQRDPVGPVNAAQITPLTNRGAAFVPLYGSPTARREYHDGLNLYQYTEGRPTVCVDPGGQFTLIELVTCLTRLTQFITTGAFAISMRGAVQRFVNAINVRNMLMDIYLRTSQTAGAMASGLQRLHHAFANIRFRPAEGAKYADIVVKSSNWVLDNANKMSHIFGDPGHKLVQFGDPQLLMPRVIMALQRSGGLPTSGRFGAIEVVIDAVTIKVTGGMVAADGVIKIGSMYAL